MTMIETLAELKKQGFTNKLNLFEKWHFRKVKEESETVWKKKLPGCTLYILVYDTIDFVRMFVKFKMFDEYHRLDFIEKDGEFGQEPYRYGSPHTPFPDFGIERTINFLKLYIANPEVTMELEMIAKESNTEYFYLFQ